jgi:hypothetical protein
MTGSTDFWSNAVDGDFDTGSNWSLGRRPGQTDDAVLGADGGAPYTVTVTGPDRVNNMVIASGDTLSIAGGQFGIQKGIDFAGAMITVTGGGKLHIGGIGSYVSQGSSISVGDGSAVRFGRVVPVNIPGSFLSSTGSGKFIVEGQFTVLGDSNATINVRAGASVKSSFDFGGAVHLAKPGGAELIASGLGENHGLVTLPSGDSIVGDSQHKDNELANFGTISGAGQIGLGKTPSGALFLQNELGGVIDATGSRVLTINTGANTIANAGTIEATGPGGGKIQSAIFNTGVLMAAGGSLTVDGEVTGTGSGVIDGGTLAFGARFAENVAFTGTTGVLELARSRGYTGSVTGFSLTGGTSLDLRDIGFVGAGEATFSGTPISGVLTVSDGTHTAHITLIGDYTGSTFVASDDGHGGVSIVDPAKTEAMAAPAHRFIAAMAGLAGSAGGAIHTDHAMPVHAPTLFKPRAMIA